jgi:PAS domain S-box-containing protein
MRKDEGHYQLAIDAARLPVWEYDVASNTVTGNVYWHRTLGYELTEDEAEQRVETWLSDVHPDDVARFEHIFSGDAADDTGFYQTEFRIRTRSGAYKWLLERGRVVERDADGAPVKVVGISVDIDSRKRMEDALRESELRLRAVIEASPVPFCLNDEHGRITFLNQAFVRAFGYSSTDIPSLSEWWARAYPDPAYRRWVEDTWVNRRQAASRTHNAFEPMEVTVRCKDGSDRTVVAQAVPLAGASAGTHLIALLDVTEQRRLETAVLAAAGREQQRIGMDLHDGLGQQLTGLSLMLIALARSARTRDVSAIEAELAMLATLASDCVATARAVAHGLAPVEMGSGGLERALRSLAESTRRTFGLDVALTLAGFETLGVEQPVSGPMFRIAQEALTNVAKHAGATRVLIDAQLARGMVTLTVADNGRGLRDAKRAKGLGLSIMRYRARALGGRVEIESPPTGGTVVRFTCPIGITDEQSAAPPPEAYGAAARVGRP